MNLDHIFNNQNEQPLDHIAQNGGYTAIFRTIACVGDSLSSGELEADAGECSSYHDYFEYSWGQFLGRACGSKIYNFSRGGMTAKEYWESFADFNRFWDSSLAAQCYIIALGVNDLIYMDHQQIGTINDTLEHNSTFAAYYLQIINRLRTIQPRAKFFLVTMPDEGELEENREIKAEHAALLHEIAEKFDNTYVIDLFAHAPKYDKSFHEKFYLRGHLNPMGYQLTAEMIGSYIDYIIRHNMDDFKEVGFIGTKLHG